MSSTLGKGAYSAENDDALSFTQNLGGNLSQNFLAFLAPVPRCRIDLVLIHVDSDSVDHESCAWHREIRRSVTNRRGTEWHARNQTDLSRFVRISTALAQNRR